MYKNKYLLLASILLSSTTLWGQVTLEGQGVKAEITSKGNIQKLTFTHQGHEQNVHFRSDKFAGPSFGENVVLSQVGKSAQFTGQVNGIEYALHYQLGNHCLEVRAQVKNGTATHFDPARLPFVLGVDTYMDKYPQWNDLYFPTFFRCEKNNFWGYMTTPKGDMITLSSPDGIGSYRYDYLNEMYGHYIYTMTFDLLCKGPLPGHHPLSEGLAPNETKTWTLRLQPVAERNQILDEVAASNGASMLTLSSHSLDLNHRLSISVNHQPAQIEIVAPSGISQCIGTATPGQELVYDDTHVYGLYQVRATNADRKVSTATFYVHPSWSWYANRVREDAMIYVPRSFKATDCCETWYQLLGFYLAEKHLPEPSSKRVGDQLLAKVLDRLFDEREGKMYSNVYTERIQNVSAMLSVLSLKYSCDGDTATLRTAQKCADFLLSRQHEKGYYGGYGMSHYTSVLYIAKSILEFMDQLEPLTHKDAYWKGKYAEYSVSVDRAMMELSQRGLNVKTEGAATFEDGSVSCSASQLLFYALRQKDPERREYFKKCGLDYLENHSCLTRLLDPDGRSRGATSRFWEAWGDIRTPMQAMLSPHGWSAWRLYASYYAYLLTGESYRLRQFMDAMGACTQLVDYPSGDLRWTFVVDPQYDGGELVPDAQQPYGRFDKKVMTAGYLRQIGDWFGRTTSGDGYLERSEWDWDGAGTTYEIFKAMEECVLPHAFVCAEGNHYLAYNCRVENSKGNLNVYISDDVVKRVHLNVAKNCKMNVYVHNKKVKSQQIKPGGVWVDIP